MLNLLNIVTITRICTIDTIISATIKNTMPTTYFAFSMPTSTNKTT